MSLTVSQKGYRVHTNITVGESAGAIVAENGNRKSLIIQNQGSVTVFIGPFGVDTSGSARGYALVAGASFTDDASRQEWWAIASSSTAILHIVEVH